MQDVVGERAVEKVSEAVFERTAIFVNAPDQAVLDTERISEFFACG